MKKFVLLVLFLLSPLVAVIRAQDGADYVLREVASGFTRPVLVTHAGDDRLRQTAQPNHDGRAEGEQPAVFLFRTADHLAEVVAGAEDRSARRDDDHAGVVVVGNSGEGEVQLAQQLPRKGIPPVRPVQSQTDDYTLSFRDQHRFGRLG